VPLIALRTAIANSPSAASRTSRCTSADAFAGIRGPHGARRRGRRRLDGGRVERAAAAFVVRETFRAREVGGDGRRVGGQFVERGVDGIEPCGLLGRPLVRRQRQQAAPFGLQLCLRGIVVGFHLPQLLDVHRVISM
jgi:hypothetical protein